MRQISERPIYCPSARNLSNSATGIRMCRKTRFGLMNPRAIKRRTVMAEMPPRYCAASFILRAPTGAGFAFMRCKKATTTPLKSNASQYFGLRINDLEPTGRPRLDLRSSRPNFLSAFSTPNLEGQDFSPKRLMNASRNCARVGTEQRTKQSPLSTTVGGYLP